MVTGPGGMPFVRCDNYVPQFATGPGDSVDQPPNNNSSSFGTFYSNTSNLPAMQVSPPTTKVVEMDGLERPAPLERNGDIVAAPKQEPHKDGSMWLWMIAIILVALILLAAWRRKF